MNRKMSDISWGACKNTKCPQYGYDLNRYDESAPVIEGCTQQYRHNQRYVSSECIHPELFIPNEPYYFKERWVQDWLKKQVKEVRDKVKEVEK